MHAVALAQTAVAHAGPYEGGPGGWWFGGFLMFLFWIAVVVLCIRFVVPGLRSWRGGSGRGDRASEILAERYARGEIEGEEYQARSQVLRDRRMHEPSPIDRARGAFATRSVHTILAERYARGEIDADEYRERLRNLEP